MKILKNFRILAVLAIIGITLFSCVQDDDFSTPEIDYNELEGVDVNTTIGEVKDIFTGGNPAYITSNSTGDVSEEMWMEAYVVSSDEKGNFYKTLVIQDSFENPEDGISISTEVTDIFSTLQPGRKVYVRVDGLYVGEYAGLPTIGVLEANEIGRMSVGEFSSRVRRSMVKENLVPNIVEINDLSENNLNTLIQLDSVQFATSEINGVYGEEGTTASVNKTIENCDGDQIILRNSGFASFSQLPIPDGNGSLVAVFSTFNDDNQLFIRSTEDVMFDETRCGGYQAIDPLAIPFTESFEGLTTGANVNLEGWANINVSGGSTLFSVRNFSGSDAYAQISAYASGEDVLNAWLVTPGLIIDANTEDPVLSFETADGFNNGNSLRVYVTTEFNGDPEASNWAEVSANISSGNNSGYGDFVSSGEIDLSNYVGEVIYVGFEYDGGENSATTTYQINDIYVGPATGSGGGGGSGGDGVLFEDSFSDGALANWNPYSVTGDLEWYYNTFGNPDDSATMSGYDDGNFENEDWLISEAIDLSGVTSATFSFDNVRRYDGNPIEVYYSTDYSGGNPTTDGTWVQLSPALDTDVSSWSSWVNSGDLDVSSAAGGDLYVAFKYTSSTSASTTIEIDNVLVEGE